MINSAFPLFLEQRVCTRKPMTLDIERIVALCHPRSTPNFNFNMEQFLLDNAERYKKLVAAFKPTAPGPKERGTAAASPDIVVSARVRPMLEDEVAQGFPTGVHIRGGNCNIADLHELQQPVRGAPRIRVSAS
jgi:hypothetical protein